MDIAKFQSSPIGSLIAISGTDGRSGQPYSHYGFAADPLSGAPEPSIAAWNRVAAANRALGRLQQGSHIAANPELLRRPTLRCEAHSTSALDGTHAPIDDVLAANNAVQKLVALGILEQVARPGVMIFRAPSVLRIVTAAAAG